MHVSLFASKLVTLCGGFWCLWKARHCFQKLLSTRDFSRSYFGTHARISDWLAGCECLGHYFASAPTKDRVTTKFSVFDPNKKREKMAEHLMSRVSFRFNNANSVWISLKLVRNYRAEESSHLFSKLDTYKLWTVWLGAYDAAERKTIGRCRHPHRTIVVWFN